MKISTLTSIALFSSFSLSKAEWFAIDNKEQIPPIVPFQIGQSVPVDCITRQIDNGEHKYDADGNIVYELFPKCRETGEPLSIKYGVNEDLNCTIGLTDNLFHMFQLYIHQDAPFSCRLPISSSLNSVAIGNSIPFTFNFRGQIAESHLDIDSNMNVVLTKPEKLNSIVSSIAWSSSTNTTRYIIGDFMTIQLAIRWLEYDTKNGFEPFASGFYKLPFNIKGTSKFEYFTLVVLTALISGAASTALCYNYLSAKFKIKGYRSLSDSESGFTKKD